MGADKLYPSPTFEDAYTRARGYQVSTPYGIVTITENGRRITFELYPDVRQSIHHKALFSYYQALRRSGVDAINVDHLDLSGLKRSLDLRRGNSKLDLVYMLRGKIHEVELKTHREVGLDVTARQLEQLSNYCENLIVVVPRRDVEDMHTVLTMLKLDQRITLDTFEILEEEIAENENGRDRSPTQPKNTTTLRGSNGFTR